MKSLKGLILTFTICLGITSGFAQNKSITLNVKNFDPIEKGQLDNAETYFEDMNFLQAIPLYEELHKKHPEEYYLKYRLGMCYLKKQDAYDKAVAYLEPVAKDLPEAADVKFYLGKAYHLTYQFDKAIIEFKEYLEQKIIKTQRPITERMIAYCENAKALVANPVDVEITNMGEPVNTEASEYVPVISMDEKEMVFTYMGKRSKGGFEDVFSTRKKKNGSWKKPEPLGDNINGYDHDACIALSPDGKILFVYRDSRDKKGEIYYSDKEGNSWSTPKPLLGEVNTNHWEGSASLTEDGKTLYFTSDKPDGLGGRDIYKATLKDDSIWTNIENLGPTINTPYNDDAPFIHPDGVTLVFSSEGHNSMGGYDIFHTQLQKDGTWKAPTNIGYPINSPDRDTYYVLSANGKTGYYSSGRPGGYGKQDLYTVEPGLAGYKPIKALLKGMVTLNNEPTDAEITIAYKNTNEHYSKLGSNAETGEYMTMLPNNEEYLISYKLINYDYEKLDGDPVRLETIKVTDSDTMIELNVNINYYSKEFKKTEEPVVVEPMAFEDIVKNFGNAEAPGLIFKVQIAAYNMPENYKYARLKGLGEVEKGKLADGITRFTIGGEFTTFNKAMEHNAKVVARGQDDAFVTAIYQGKRVYLRELIDLGVFKLPSK